MIPVKPAIAAAAEVGSLEQYRRRHAESLEQNEAFWRREAESLDWIREPDSAVRGDFRQLDLEWFGGGQLNVTANCIDRHLATQPDKTALIWAQDEVGQYQRISYRQLAAEVARAANVLRRLGVRKGDRVAIYLPMVPQLAYAMLACARIGAIHSVVFAGFSANALRDRIVDAECRVLITADEGLRGGKTIPLKTIADQALIGQDSVEHVLVVERTGSEIAWNPRVDRWWHEETARERPVCPAEPMESEDPLFVLYTSGSTGKPKGVLHSTAGYLLYASLTHRLVFDLHPDDVYCCAADCGWITGHSYIVYGPLANGATTVLFESTPMYPDASRYWRLVDDLEVDIFYTAPTALRAIAREGDEWLESSSRRSLRVLGTVGEPINPEVWEWYHDVVGRGDCAVVDTWWQTETGGILITPLPGATPTKPGSATLPFFGIEPILVDDEGHELEGNGVEGNLCLRRPWPGMARTIWGDHQRYFTTYFERFPGLYFTGDGCRRDEDGYYWITGRVDDVLNVSGHRMGTAEVESALVAHSYVAEAAVVGFPHEIKGTGIQAFVIVTDEAAALDEVELVRTLETQVREEIGPIAKPDRIVVTPGLPKTRSGKIMRRILRSIAAGKTDDLGDTSTLADPSVVQSLVEAGDRES